MMAQIRKIMVVSPPPRRARAVEDAVEPMKASPYLRELLRAYFSDRAPRRSARDSRQDIGQFVIGEVAFGHILHAFDHH
jgi:hypothetical protein